MDGIAVVGHEEVSPIPPRRIDERSNVGATRMGLAPTPNSGPPLPDIDKSQSWD
jgi:hypothetical protein